MDILKSTLSIPIFQGLNQEELKAILQIGVKQQFAPNVDLIKEGEKSEDFFVLLDGKVDILKAQSKDEAGKEVKLATLSGGDICGEMSFIDHEPRFLTIRTVESTTILRLTDKSLLMLPNGELILNKLIKNLAKFSVNRFKSFQDVYLCSLQKTFELFKERQLFGSFFIMLLLFFSLFTITEYFIDLLHFNIKSSASSTTRMIIICSPCLYWILKYKIPFKNFGLTTVAWKISAIEGLIIGLLLSAGSLIVASISTDATLKNTFHQFINSFHPSFLVIFLYAISAFVQEFFARGVFQTSLQKFLNDKNGFYTVLVMSIGFGGIHAFRGWLFVLLTFIGGMIFGLFYLRRPNLVGVTIAHFIGGIVALNISSLSS